MTRRIIGVMLAVILAVFGTAAVLYYVSTVRSQVADGQKAVRVLVANDRIPAGTTGAHMQSANMLATIVVPASSVPEDALSSIPQDLDQLVITSDLQPRQLLMRGMFGQATTLSGGLTIPEGKVAVTVQVGIPQQVAGYVRPGSQIAIFDTYAVTSGSSSSTQNSNNKATRVLLPRVEVIATGTYFTDGSTSSQRDNTDTADGSKSGGQSMVVTVAVTQPEAERLIQATQTGALYFALLTDSSDVKIGPGVTNLSMFS
jgi:pilus assembly protein CpaB